MEKGAKLHSFVSVILGCSLAIIEETKKKTLKTHAHKWKWMKKGSKEREKENLPQLDEKWHKGLEIRHKWMKSGAKHHSFIRAIVGCSLANIHFRKIRGTNKSQK